ncbi:MAG: Grx4 family monothiol glutaredoxin [Oligoflexia bacterium]|nr:Grx4 family monothiol glutaredoxin [Oligoflexia bacterium]
MFTPCQLRHSPLTNGQKGANVEQDALKKKIEETVKSNPIVIFMKGTKEFPMCGFSARAVQVLQTLKKPIFDIDVLSDDPLWGALEEYTQWPTVPQIFINGEFVGGCDIVTELHERGELEKMAQ